MANRRTVLATLGSAAAAAIAPAARAQTPAPLRVGLIPIIDVAPFYAAQQQGFFTAEGVAVEPTIVRGGAAGLPALTAGSLDVLYTNPASPVLAIAQGIDLRIILQGFLIGKAPPDPGALLKRTGDPIKSGKDLEGKVVGVNGLKDISWMYVVGWIKATGGDPDKVRMVEVPIAALAEAIKEKRIDTAFLPDPFMTTALSDSALALLDWPMSKVCAEGPGALYVITPQLAAQRPRDVRAFVRAYRRGAAWVNANAGKDALFALIGGYSQMNMDILRKVKMPPANADIIPSSLPRVTALMTYTGIPTGGVDLRTKVFS